VAALRAALRPNGKSPERVLNLMPLLARYGVGVFDAMLAEARRLLVGGGELVLAEHVAASAGVRRAAQRLVRPAWKALLGGCDPLTDPRASLSRVGLDTSDLHARALALPWVVSPGVVGRARPR
jgi:hypothetical protein